MDESTAEVHMNCAGHRSKMGTDSKRDKNKIMQLTTLPGWGSIFCLAPNARIEKKKREEEEKRLAEQKCGEEAAAKKATEEAEAATKAKKAAEGEGDLLSEFVNGGKSGEGQGAILPSVEKLVYHLLISTQKDDPNPECAWAESTNYGAALVTLREENLAGMMEVLFAIQGFCNDIGFPKVGTEGLIQAMFRSVYKFDLVNEV
jgi:hypothetical protein